MLARLVCLRARNSNLTCAPDRRFCNRSTGESAELQIPLSRRYLSNIPSPTCATVASSNELNLPRQIAVTCGIIIRDASYLPRELTRRSLAIRTFLYRPIKASHKSTHSFCASQRDKKYSNNSLTRKNPLSTKAHPFATPSRYARKGPRTLIVPLYLDRIVAYFT